MRVRGGGELVAGNVGGDGLEDAGHVVEDGRLAGHRLGGGRAA